MWTMTFHETFSQIESWKRGYVWRLFESLWTVFWLVNLATTYHRPQLLAHNFPTAHHNEYLSMILLLC